MKRVSVREDLRAIIAGSGNRQEKAKCIAAAIRKSGSYRWVGIYDVDQGQGKVSNIAWSGPGAPAHPVFSITQGLTGTAIAQKKTVNSGDVAQDPRYLTAFGTTRSEIIVPVFAESSGSVVGTIDVESEVEAAFDGAAQSFLEECARSIRGLWAGSSAKPARSGRKVRHSDG